MTLVRLEAPAWEELPAWLTTQMGGLSWKGQITYLDCPRRTAADQRIGRCSQRDVVEIKGALFVSYRLDSTRRWLWKKNSRITVRHWDDFERKIRELPLANTLEWYSRITVRHNYAVPTFVSIRLGKIWWSTFVSIRLGKLLFIKDQRIIDELKTNQK